MMQILVAPSGFKESLEPDAAADCIEAGILRAVPNAIIRKVPLFDGGEGFARALVASTGGNHEIISVMGPVKERVDAYYGFLGSGGPRTAVIEIAEAAGLRLVPKNRRDPTSTTSYGVGELIKAALDQNAEQILVGCGDSGTSDGGIGMCQALGVRFLDREGYSLPRAGGGKTLVKLAKVDLSGLHPRLKKVEIDVLCNWKNILCGPQGVAKVYGPQKGASPGQVTQLILALENYAAVLKGVTGKDLATMPGGGASGGLGAGFVLLGAGLRPRFETITEYFGIENLFDECHLVFTAEGGIDYQTPQGKIPGELAVRAKRRGLPVIAIAGTIGTGAYVNYDAGIDAFTSIIQAPTSLQEAVAQAPQLLTESAEAAMRMIMVGRGLVVDKSEGEQPTNMLQVVPLSGARFQYQVPRFMMQILLIITSFVLPICLSWFVTGK